MAERNPMPMRTEVDPMFDGHLERPLLALTVSERLDWIWEAMQLLWLGRVNREVKQMAGEDAQRASETMNARPLPLQGAGLD